MLGGGAGAPQTCAGERSHSDVTRDLGRAASTEGVTAVPPQQPPPDAARVRIVLRSATSCASRKARIRSARLVRSHDVPIDVAPVPEAPGRITRGGSAGSPLQSSATHFARIESELTPAPRIGEHVVRDRPCNRRDRARFASMPIVVSKAGWCTPTYVSAIVSRLRTLALLGLIVVLTDVAWDGESLHVSIGWPGRRRIVHLVVPRRHRPLTGAKPTGPTPGGGS
jgi:hypothetical protein